MPLRKIRDLPTPPWKAEQTPRCVHPEHNPPGHMVFEPGEYEYECPGCGEKRTFIVDRTYLKG